jgi:hypothetical protein
VQSRDAAARVDRDAVAIAHQRNRAARRGLGTNVPHHHAARRAGKASIGQQRHLLAHALTIEERRNAQHLAHAGPATRPFVADDEHVARTHLARAHLRRAGLLAVEDARTAIEGERLQARDLDQPAFRAKVPL